MEATMVGLVRIVTFWVLVVGLVGCQSSKHPNPPDEAMLREQVASALKDIVRAEVTCYRYATDEEEELERCGPFVTESPNEIHQALAFASEIIDIGIRAYPDAEPINPTRIVARFIDRYTLEEVEVSFLVSGRIGFGSRQAIAITPRTTSSMQFLEQFINDRVAQDAGSVVRQDKEGVKRANPN